MHSGIQSAKGNKQTNHDLRLAQESERKINEYRENAEAHHRDQNNDTVQSQETCFADVFFNLDSRDIEKEQSDNGEEARKVNEGVGKNLPNLAAQDRMRSVKSKQSNERV